MPGKRNREVNMVELKIDNSVLRVKEGTTILEAARMNGINIPSLCYNKELPHFTSCMVCMVRDVRSGKFIPSCSATVIKGQEIDASGPDVIKLRKEALSLLLSEHRAECEAPCRNVCPAAYNIPAVNRHLSLKNYRAAYDEIRDSIKEYGFACESCPAPCEKACRRKMIDKTISIRNILIYLHKQHVAGEKEKKFEAYEKPKKFNSLIGKIEESEKSEWLKECNPEAGRHDNPSNGEELADEAASCMHCDCRALEKCRLRDYCEEHEIKNPVRLRTGPPIVKKINKNTGLVFENAKCIKCGLCVRISTESTKNPSLCFTGRGFMSLISEPLSYGFEDLSMENIKKAVEVCPTGALMIDRGLIEDSYD